MKPQKLTTSESYRTFCDEFGSESEPSDCSSRTATSLSDFSKQDIVGNPGFETIGMVPAIKNIENPEHRVTDPERIKSAGTLPQS